MDHLQRLYEHMRWADRLVVDALAVPGVPPRAIELFAHVLAAEHVWLMRIRGRPAKVAVWPSLTREECAKLAAENAVGFGELVAELDGSRAAQVVPYTNSAGFSFASRIDDILLHVALHGTYHRGQVALLLRGADKAPAATDFIAFVRGAPAATRTPPG